MNTPSNNTSLSLEQEVEALRDGLQTLIHSDDHIFIQQLRSPATGDRVVNQIQLTIGPVKAFFSYGTLCAVKNQNEVSLSSSWDYSKTTLKYLKVFLNDSEMTMKDIRNKIKSGEYKLDKDLTIGSVLMNHKSDMVLAARASFLEKNANAIKNKSPTP